MAGQAGWYRAPGEEGILRYWNGSIWTEHRQPNPAAITATEIEAPAVDPDPMAEYERQFDTPSIPDSDFDQPGYDFGAHSFDSTPATPSEDVTPPAAQPQYRPQTALTSSPVVPAPEFAGKAATAPRSLGPIALGPATPAPTPTIEAPVSEFDQLYNEVSALAEAPVVDAAPAPLVESPPVVTSVATGVGTGVGITPNRKAVLVAVRIMAGAIIVILLSVAAMVILSLQSSAGPGEVETNAIVTSLGARTSDSCTPIARFAVAGKSYTANSSAAITPCPIGLGESVEVVYSATNPASAARIEVGSSAAQYLWVLPIVAGLVFVGGLITFIIRAGSIVGGITLLREGRARPKEPVAA